MKVLAIIAIVFFLRDIVLQHSIQKICKTLRYKL